MQARLAPDSDTLTLEFDDPAAAEKFFADAKSQAGFFLQLERELKQFERLRVIATAPSFRFRFEAEVVQVFPAVGMHGTAFQLCDWTTARERELELRLKSRETQEEDPFNVSPVFRIKKMDVNARFRLAIKASRPERQILLRDNSPQVLLGLLAHPRLEDKEVKAIIDSPASNAAIMQRVAGNRKWMANSEILFAVVRSPKTASPLAIKLLPQLRTGELRALAKGGAGRQNVRQAALRVYLKRTGKS